MRAVQVMPSGEVMIRAVPPKSATATNVSCPGTPPQVTEFQLLSAAEVRLVQVVPSGDVMTRLPVPLLATATNFSCPAGPPQVTEFHALGTAAVRVVHTTPGSAADESVTK